MNEFDELLCDVLAADGSVEPPPGMKRRMEAALRDVTHLHRQARRTPSEAIAAALLIGVAGMAVIRHHSGIPQTSVSHEWASIPKADGLRVAPSSPGVQKVAPKRDYGRISPRVASSERDRRRTAAGIAPLTIESLVIEPVEIASLASDKRIENSTDQGEQR